MKIVVTPKQLMVALAVIVGVALVGAESYEIPPPPEQHVLVNEELPCVGGQCAHEYVLPQGYSSVTSDQCSLASPSRVLTLLDERRPSNISSRWKVFRVVNVMVADNLASVCRKLIREISFDPDSYSGIQGVEISNSLATINVVSREANPLYQNYRERHGADVRWVRQLYGISGIAGILLLAMLFVALLRWSGIDDEKVRG